MNRSAQAHSSAVSPCAASPILTREFLASGGMEAIVVRDSPGLVLLTDEERRQSLEGTLAARPTDDVWVFGYGSLIWNPGIRFAERRVARVEGWHRAFCLSITAVRGSPSRPGLMLALNRGGHCFGAAYRIADADLTSELALLWRREMLCGAYVPRWIGIADEEGRKFAWAIAFTIDSTSAQYAGHLEEAAVVERLATASGGLGSASDYLFRTRDGLRAQGIPDLKLEQLADRVAAWQLEVACTRGSADSRS